MRARKNVPDIGCQHPGVILPRRPEGTARLPMTRRGPPARGPVRDRRDSNPSTPIQERDHGSSIISGSTSTAALQPVSKWWRSDRESNPVSP